MRMDEIKVTLRRRKLQLIGRLSSRIPLNWGYESFIIFNQYSSAVKS